MKSLNDQDFYTLCEIYRSHARDRWGGADETEFMAVIASYLEREHPELSEQEYIDVLRGEGIDFRFQ